MSNDQAPQVSVELAILSRIQALTHDVGLLSDLMIKVSIQQSEQTAALQNLREVFLDFKQGGRRIAQATTKA